MDPTINTETPLNGAITFALMWALRQLPQWDKRPAKLDFLIPIAVSAIEAGCAALIMGKPLADSWHMAVTNLVQSVTAHKLLTDSPAPYNS